MVSVIVIGLSSGTSVDGIDAAVADLRLEGGEVLLDPLGHLTAPYPPALRDEVLAALPPAATTLEQVCRIDTGIGRAFAAAARTAMAELCPGGTADLAVSHGQTLYHWVEDGAVKGSLQLGQPAWITEATGLPVVSDVRAADIAAGGQGAPLASVFDVLWLSGLGTPAAAVNIGGIANLTVVSPDAPPTAFDTGPGNALLDAAAELAPGTGRMDAGGERALRGQVVPELMERLLAEPYFARPAPKTTGKELFNTAYLERALAGVDASWDDVFATLTDLTAVTIADACKAHGVGEAVASGGGVHNHGLMQSLRAALAPVPVRGSEALGVDPDAKEAYLFALLGFLTWHGIPSTVPECTGAAHPVLSGRVGRPESDAPLPARLRIRGDAHSDV
ncbi:anhydro-N-acetylmuramic acid kinase [Nocardiopsis sp. RSe5-2]|uniref:Anhydro-N-acetylmuramic acid kinase n=1 Tax=Nocardiopsis endophytica TaxID=3018445 RepID=A0ABT4TX25_9ACTN|nr:anhydro-N-acetylmuramic acid kinase [Nocardiopsis endophytica]MDA2809249.1 anhydro-N-acetylmuramic acid kinase [Nocardiopsis endophytica]